MKMSAFSFIPCIYIFENNNFNLKESVTKFDYIKFIYNISKLEINIIKLKSQFINENNIINNNFFYFLKKEFK